jgi:8-oxo-dGTP pyrophosphatase MutT (NUDIX family)
MRMRVLKDGGAMAAFLDYQRSRMRIVRGSSLNLLIGAVVAFVFFARSDEWTHAGILGGGLLALTAVCVVADERIKSAYLERLVDAYREIVDPSKRKKDRPVVAAVPYRWRDGQPYLLLVRTSGGRLWTFPKGHVEKKDASAAAAAAREAWEEAGVKGQVEEPPFTHYRYRSTSGDEQVAAYLMEVTEAAEPWLEDPTRRPEWLPVPKARKRLRRRRDKRYGDQHDHVVDKALKRLQTRAERPSK